MANGDGPTSGLEDIRGDVEDLGGGPTAAEREVDTSLDDRLSNVDDSAFFGGGPGEVGDQVEDIGDEPTAVDREPDVDVDPGETAPSVDETAEQAAREAGGQPAVDQLNEAEAGGGGGGPASGLGGLRGQVEDIGGGRDTAVNRDPLGRQSQMMADRELYQAAERRGATNRRRIPNTTPAGAGLDPGMTAARRTGRRRSRRGGDQSSADGSGSGVLSDIGAVFSQAQEEGLESVERGGAFSEAARDITAAGLGVLFQNPEEIGSGIGISERRIQEQDTTVSGPGVTGVNPVSDEQLVEFDYGERGDLDQEVVDDLTEGQGFLSDEGRADVQEDIQQRQETFGLGDEAASAVGSVTDDERATGVARGVGRLTGDLAGATAGLTLAADTAVETAPNIPGAVSEYGAGTVGYTVLESGGRATEDVVRGIEARPYEFAGSLGGAVVGGALAGRAAGSATRYGRDRVRTAGADVYDIEGGEITNPETGQYYADPDADVGEGARFPGAEDPSLYESQPAAAVRTQAEDYTPTGVEQRYQQQGVEEGVTLKKGLDVEPEGPGQGRRGFQTQEGSYESPGGFAGPELSPNFLGRERRGSQFSLRPGLPDLGDQATGVLVRTEVDEPNARNLDEFNEELLGRSGETTARTKPASEVDSGEIEAVIPPDAEFADIGGGTGRNLMRRAGIGSDFAVRIGGRDIPFTDRQVGGRRIPLRPVADPDLVDTQQTRGFGDFLQSERAQFGPDAGSAPRTRRLSEIQRPAETPTDRPLPVPPSAPAAGEPDADTDPEPVSVSRPAGRDDTATESTTGTTPGGDRRRDSSDGGVSSVSFGISGVSSPGGGASGDEEGSPAPSVPSPPGGPSPPGSPDGPPSSPGLPPGSPDDPGMPFSPSPGSPGAPTPTPNPVVQRPDRDGDRDDDEFFAPLGGARDPVFTDFLDPLTGETLETSRESPL